MTSAGKTIKLRLKSLEQHLRKENPVLVDAVQSYRHLDRVGYSLGLLNEEQSFATQISWWPMISVLGTFSAGKSTFINHYLGQRLQPTGNQAVDDKFTVICLGGEHGTQALPGTALDADPRFPFYQISNELEKVAQGEGSRVDTYLQLKTSPSENLRGRILIDSPGFDADSQRNATLRLTDHIIDLSDLVLVFFDARHPEPGAMRDTLKHLVGDTIHRADATKFVFILNQMDTTARDDNPEEVVGAWQRAMAQEGLTTGRFYCTYNPDVAVTIEDDATRQRYESKRDHDLEEIHQRIQRVGVDRAYRITGALEKIAHRIEDKYIPQLVEYKRQWRKIVLWGDALIVAAFLGLSALTVSLLGHFGSFQWDPSNWKDSTVTMVFGVSLLGVVIGVITHLHFRIRQFATARVLPRIVNHYSAGIEGERLSQAFIHNTRSWRSLFRKSPVGWNRRCRKRLQQVIAEANQYVQKLNDTFTDPSGDTQPEDQAMAPQDVVSPVSDTDDVVTIDKPNRSV